MKKFTIKGFLIAVVTLASAPFAQAQYHDDFSGANDTTGLQARGYLTYFRGAGGPGAAPHWFQGNPNFSLAFNGNDSDFVMSNYQSVGGANDIDNWLVLPALNVTAGDGISFYSKSVQGSTFPDSIRVMYAANGDSVPEDLGWVELGRFKVNTQGIWQLKTFFVTTGGTNARFAIRYAVVDGGPSGSNSDAIGIDELNVFTPAAEDGGVSGINVSSGCSLSATTAIDITVENFGLNPISNFPVSYTINGGTPVVETFTATVNAASTATYTFATTANFSAAGSYAISASTAITNDGNASNDTDTFTITSTSPNPLVNPILMSFEPADDITGWFIGDDQDADGVTWAVVSSLQFNNIPHTGDQAIRLGGSNSADDWAYTACLDLLSTENYNLEFWYKQFAVAASPEFEAKIGMSQNAAAMTQTLVTGLALTDTAYTQHSANFSVPVSGIYYIGLHAYSTAATATSVRIDDVNITDVGPLGIAKLNKDVVSVYPNPSTGVFNVNTIAASTDVVIYNALGEKVYSNAKLTAGAHTIDLSTFAEGVYTVKAFSNNSVEVKKITIN
ncbi:MAG TPA: choice-of-anchor J domain-containing protein [Bacteroidia bacterium]|nr:choice-of-anchor J domain-containing protein [Bacteroidia bacterium]